MNRRFFLAAAGGATVIVAGGGAWRATRQGVFRTGQGPAFEPWESWRSESDTVELAMVRAAILASNPHNTQPWLFRVEEGAVEVYADEGRNLGSFDPYLREMHIGLGCAVENMALAAQASGYQPSVTLADGTLELAAGLPERRLVATVALTPAARRPTPLYEAVPRRHTNRAAYDGGRALSAEALGALRGMADGDGLTVLLFVDPEARRRLGEVVIEATEWIVADAEMSRDSDHWFRHDWSEIQRRRDGLTLDTVGMPPLRTALAKMLPRMSADSAHEYWLDDTRNVHVATTPVLGLIAVRHLYDRAQTLGAGRVWQRQHLWATSQGLAMQPLNQPVEMVDRDRQLGRDPYFARRLQEVTGDPSWTPTFVFRAGFPLREVPPSPRRHLEQVSL